MNAYAAAIFGRLRSLPLTFVGAIVIGLTEGYLFGYLPNDNQYLIGLRPAASVIILFLVLLMLPNPRLRTHGRLREFFPAPSMQGAALFAGIALAGGVVMATTLGAVDLITYGQIFSIGIVALSLVPLVGLAGQISLAQLGFAGIGAVVMAHQGAGGNPLGVLLAVVVAAAVGALVALPVLRLSGIYLALATAAFAVALDRWIFNLPDFDVGPMHISIFTRGSVDVDPLRVFGYAFDTPARQLLLANVAFVAVAMLVVAVRRSGFGRRLLAIRDSEAACATFGLNLVGTRLAVFTLSAGIAGLGGAIYAIQLNSINPTRFDLVVGLPIFMLVVVGGAGLVGGALFAGASLNGLLPLVATLGATAARWSTMAPGLVGIGLGRNPSGAVQDMSEGVAPLRRDRTVLAGMFAVMALWYALRLLDVITNWPFVILLALTFVAANVVAMLRARAAGRSSPSPTSSGWASPPRGRPSGSSPSTAPSPSTRYGSVPRLEVRGVSVRFGGNVALDDASLSADAGRVTGLIGPNGAGKTTLFNVVTGLLPPTSGSVAIDGSDITRLNPHKRARRGLARTFQRLELFTMLTVRENIRVAADIHRKWSRDKEDPAARTDAIIGRIGLRATADVRVTALPTGQGRLVELGRALACKPTVLLLDEPASGQDDSETEQFARLLRELADEGVAVVLVEHDVQLVMAVCDVISVLDFGRVIANGTPADIQSDEAVLAAYLGAAEEPA